MRIILYYIGGLKYILNGKLEKKISREKLCKLYDEIRIEYGASGRPPPMLYDNDVTRSGMVQGV